MMNQTSAPNKMSKIEKASQYYIVVAIFAQAIVCLCAALYAVIWRNSNLDGIAVTDAFTYLGFNFANEASADWVLEQGWPV